MTSKKPTLQDAVSRFGQSAKAKLGNPSAVGAPGDQLRAPFERLLMDMAACTGCAAGTVVAVGETALTELRTRPDYAVTPHGALVDFVKIKAPGKGCRPASSERRARQGPMGKTAIASQPAVHRRQ